MDRDRADRFKVSIQRQKIMIFDGKETVTGCI
jgi:hypothetical protein